MTGTATSFFGKLRATGELFAMRAIDDMQYFLSWCEERLFADGGLAMQQNRAECQQALE
jgi:hypothetical protein